MTDIDPSQNYLERLPQSLDVVFHPKSIAIIGATEKPGSVGQTLMANLNNGIFKGKLFPINPKRDEVLGLKCYPDIASIPEAVDLAIIVTPAKTVAGIVQQCVDKKIPAAIIISAGFKELGESGAALEEQILQIAREGNLRIIGPNCLGVMNPIIGLNATFAADLALKGNIAFISQSGAMCTAVLDWSLKENVGFSSFVSIGSMADVNWGDLIDYLGHDPHTESILIYMETIGDARAFISAAREVTLNKPIIVIKAGRTEAAAKAAASHTGSLAGSDEVFEAAMQRAGVLRVSTISELFDMALILSKQPKPQGNRLTIITNAGGPGVLATDEAIFHGAEMAEISKETIDKLSEFLPEAWSHSNPVDVLGDANADRYAKTLEVVAHDPDTDGILVILSPQDVTDPTGTAKRLKEYAHLFKKPIFASWMGGKSVEEGLHLLNQAGIPAFEYPDSAGRAFSNMWRYSDNLKALYETPADLYPISLSKVEGKSKQELVEDILSIARNENRTLLTELESKQVLEAYEIPTVKTVLAQTAKEAAQAAEDIGFPVVVKINSKTLTHKTDIGGVKLNIIDKEGVITAFNDIETSVTNIAGKEHFQGVTVQEMVSLKGYEIIIGSSCDSQFGPVLLFGTGGSLVEVYKDRALGLPPLNSTLATRLMSRTKIYTALQGVRGQKSIDFAALEKVLIGFSYLISQHPSIAELDINPLLVSSDQMIALDARIVMHDLSLKEEDLPKLAIRPYPIKYLKPIKLNNEKIVILRPIRPEDEKMLIEFHKTLLTDSVRQRYLKALELDERIAHERLVRMCCIDYDRCIAMVAEIREPGSVQPSIIGVIRLLRIPGTKNGDFRIIIADPYHNQGLGTQMFKQIISMAKEEGMEALEASILKENQLMIKMCEREGFKLSPDREQPQFIRAILKLI